MTRSPVWYHVPHRTPGPPYGTTCLTGHQAVRSRLCRHMQRAYMCMPPPGFTNSIGVSTHDTIQVLHVISRNRSSWADLKLLVQQVGAGWRRRSLGFLVPGYVIAGVRVSMRHATHTSSSPLRHTHEHATRHTQEQLASTARVPGCV